MIKKCFDCKEEKVTTEFNKNSSRKDGLQLRCRECDRLRAKKAYHGKYREYFLQKNQQNLIIRKQWLQDYKMGKCCKNCSESRWYVLDFHHRGDSEKISEISTMITNGRSIENIQKEIEKCDLLCANCHREVHHLKRLEKLGL
jgi:hypothetical protein